MSPAPTRDPRRRAAAGLVLVAAVVLHAALILSGGSDPHKRFGFRPFQESDTWRAEVVRVTAAGERIPIDDGTWVYEWDELVDVSELRSPGRSRHANGGARGTVDLLARALDWLADNTPADLDTIRFEATVSLVHNRGEPEVIVLVGEPKGRE